MRFDLKRPCEICPFVNSSKRITFACRERAEEIEEIAYRNGFVCHEHAVHVEDDLLGESYFDFGPNSQHCWGALAMYVRDGGANVPWERLSEEEQARWWDRADLEALDTVFESEEAFIEANDGRSTEQG